jgi:hypothetical protein
MLNDFKGWLLTQVLNNIKAFKPLLSWFKRTTKQDPMVSNNVEPMLKKLKTAA